MATVAPEARTVLVYCSRKEIAILTAADILTGGVLPEFSILIAEVFA